MKKTTKTHLWIVLGACSFLSTSIFSAALAPVDVTHVRVSPNPWRADRHSGGVRFDQFNANASIKIFTVSGHKVKSLPATNTQVEWDLTNDSGDLVASGVYLFVLTTDQGQKKTGKIVVIK